MIKKTQRTVYQQRYTQIINMKRIKNTVVNFLLMKIPINLKFIIKKTAKELKKLRKNKIAKEFPQKEMKRSEIQLKIRPYYNNKPLIRKFKRTKQEITVDHLIKKVIKALVLPVLQTVIKF